MDELYSILEQSLCIEYKLTSLKRVMEMLSSGQPDESCADRSDADVKFVMNVMLAAIDCIIAQTRENAAALDDYIADNASKVRREVGN